MVSRICRRVAVYGDCGGWERVACGEEQRGDGGSDIVWVGEQRGCIGSERWGRTEEKKRFFSFFGKVVGCGSDGMMIFR